ncbi:unnamed protein product [Prorocentrum cordatum]|uniref:Uncharacterized protein n=1 Tax=Prorocentrum cordatum TaxID=2364126 RepID=A0ABN9XCG4_9DINO|nr:unnamed protein product [Polarella glacialis]
MASMRFFLSAILAVQAKTALATNASPIAKVLEMIRPADAKVISEGEESHKVFSEFAEMCEDRSRQLGFSIKTAEGQITDLKATLAKEAANSEELDTKIGALATEIATDTADLKAATEIRTKEQADFAQEEKELVDVIDTITRAKGILEKEMAKSGGASMLQLRNAGGVADALRVMVQASVISSTDASKLTALVQSAQQQEADDDDAALGAPDAAVYEGHSGGGAAHDGIIGVLEDLLAKAEGQLDGLRKAETSSLQNFERPRTAARTRSRTGTRTCPMPRRPLPTARPSRPRQRATSRPPRGTCRPTRRRRRTCTRTARRRRRTSRRSRSPGRRSSRRWPRRRR